MLDEVDLLLHPLKSELHWPLGARGALDFTQGKGGPGLRWRLPQWLLGAVTAAWDGQLTCDVSDSLEASRAVAALKAAVLEGLERRCIQRAPHPVLLDPPFYEAHMRPALTRWALLWLADRGTGRVPQEQARGERGCFGGGDLVGAGLGLAGLAPRLPLL